MALATLTVLSPPGSHPDSVARSVSREQSVVSAWNRRAHRARCSLAASELFFKRCSSCRRRRSCRGHRRGTATTAGSGRRGRATGRTGARGSKSTAVLDLPQSGSHLRGWRPVRAEQEHLELRVLQAIQLRHHGCPAPLDQWAEQPLSCSRYSPTPGLSITRLSNCSALPPVPCDLARRDIVVPIDVIDERPLRPAHRLQPRERHFNHLPLDAPDQSLVRLRSRMPGFPPRDARVGRVPLAEHVKAAAADAILYTKSAVAFRLDPVDCDDMWVTERGGGLASWTKPRRRVSSARRSGGRTLIRDLPPEPQIPCAVDLAHASGAEQREDLV